MKNLFDPESTLMRGFSLIANFFLLNLLWLLCSLPIVTMGAATTALYDAMFRYLKNGDDTIFKPFFRAFRENFRQATLVWIPLLLLMALLVLDWMFLVVHLEGLYFLMWFPFVVLLALAAAVLVHYFPMAARYRMTVGQMLKSSLAFGILHPIRTVAVFLLDTLPLILLLTAPYLFYVFGFFWVTVWFPFSALLSTKLLLKTFSRYSEEERSC